MLRSPSRRRTVDLLQSHEEYEVQNAIIKFLKQRIYFQLLETVLATISAASLYLLLCNIYIMPMALEHGMPYVSLVTAFTIPTVIFGTAIYLFFKVLKHGIATATPPLVNNTWH